MSDLQPQLRSFGALAPWEANRIAFHGHHKHVADAIGKSPSLVAQHCLPPQAFDEVGDGQASPLQRVVESELALIAAGAPTAGFSLRYLSTFFGYVPPVRIADVPTQMSILNIAEAVSEFSQYLESVADAGTSVDTAEEAARVRIEIEGLMTLLGAQLQAAVCVEKRALAVAVRERIGPRRSIPPFISLQPVAVAL